MNILILGASGFLGQSFVRILRHHRLTLVTRCPKKKKALLTNTNQTVLLWHELIKQPKFLKTIDVVINCCGQSIQGIWTKSFKQELIDSRTQPLVLLLSLLKSIQHEPKIISMSGVGYYGAQPKIPNYHFSEEDHPKHPLFLSKTAALAENALANYPNQCILRLGVVLSHHGGAFPLMKLPHYLNLGATLGTGHHPFSWVALEDVHAIVQHILNKNLTGTYNVCTPLHETHYQFQYQLAKCLNRSLWLQIPTIFTHYLGQMVYETLVLGQWVTTNKLQKTGYVFKVNHLGDLFPS